MAIAASTIISRVETVLQDTTNVRWPKAELVQWFNDGQREIVLFKPESSVTNTTLSLTTNNTKQTLPSNAIRLIDVIRNMGSGGATPGRSVRLVNREVLDAQRPTWHSETGAAVLHYMFDARDPRTFYVYPAPASTLHLELVYSVAPTDVTESGGVVSGNLALDDIYANAVVDFILYRAYTKDSEYAGNANRAVAHYTAFANSIGIRTKTDLDRSPNANSVGNPNYPAQAKASLS